MCLYGLFGPWPSAERRQKRRTYPDCEICCRKRIAHPAAVRVSHPTEVKYKTRSRCSRGVRRKKHSGDSKTDTGQGDCEHENVHEDDKIFGEEQSNDVQENGEQNVEEPNSGGTKIDEPSNDEPNNDGPKQDEPNDYEANNNEFKANDAAEDENGKAGKVTDEKCEGSDDKPQAKCKGGKQSRRKKRR